MSAERTVARNTIWLTLQPLSMNVLSLAATMYLTRQLGAAEWGRFNLCLAFVAMLTPLANLGLRTLANRHAAQHRDTANEFLGQVLVLRVLFALLTALLLIGAAPLAVPGGRVVVAVMAFGLVVTSVAQTLLDGFQAFEVVRPASIAQFIGGGVLTLASVVAVCAGGGIRELAIAYALGPIVTCALLWRWSRGCPFRPKLAFRPSATGPLLLQGLPFFAIILLADVSSRVDVLVMSRVFSEVTLGCYTAAMSLVDRGTMLVDGMATALLPAVAQLGTRGRGSARALLQKAALWCLAVMLPIAVLVTVFAPQAIHLVFGPEYRESVSILAVGIWRLPLMALAVVAGLALFAAGEQRVELKTNALAIVAALALLYPAVLWLGPIGGPVAGTFRYVIAWFLRAPALREIYPGLWPWRQFLRVVGALGCLALPLLFVPLLPDGMIRLALAPVSLLGYLMGLQWAGLVSLRDLIRRVQGRMRRSSAPSPVVGAPLPIESGSH